MPNRHQQNQSEKLDTVVAWIICLALFFLPPAISERLNPVLTFLPIAIERIQKRSKD